MGKPELRPFFRPGDTFMVWRMAPEFRKAAANRRALSFVKALTGKRVVGFASTQDAKMW